MNSAASQRRQRGLTLVESMIVLAVTAVAAGVVAPSFEQARERRHVEGIAAQMETDFALARSQAMAQNRNLRLDFAGPRCYVVHDGPAASCVCGDQGVAQCSGDVRVYRVMQLDPAVPVTMQSNSASIGIDAVRGVITPTATVQVRSAGGMAVHNVINLRGRVRQCAPAPGLTGYATC